MKKLVIVILLISSSLSYAQITKIVRISNQSIGNGRLSALYHYDQNNNLQDIQLLFLGTDDRYLHSDIFKYDTIYVASPANFVSHLNSIISFFESNEPEVSTEINNHQVVVAKHLGMKVLYLFSEEGQGFNIVKVNRIKRMRDEAVKWADDTGVSLSTSGT